MSLSLFRLIPSTMLAAFLSNAPVYASHVRPPGTPLQQPPGVTEKTKRSSWSVSDYAAVTSAISSSLLLIVTTVAISFAACQLRDARRQRRGHFLLELDARWTSERMQNGHKQLFDLTQRINEDIQRIKNTKKYPLLSSLDDENKKMRMCSVYLFIMRKYDRDSYREINNVIEYYETIGVIIYKIDGLELEAVANLLAGAIETVNKITRRHIEQARKIYEEPGLFEHATRLFDDTLSWLDKIKAGSSS